MKLTTTMNGLRPLERRGIRVLSKNDLAKLEPGQHPKALEKSIQTALNAGLIERAARGFYVIKAAAERSPSYLLDELARAMRPGQMCYLSLESVLSQHGIISQIPINTITVMTTGRSGRIETPYGVVDYVHTKRPLRSILDNTVTDPKQPLRIATRQAALRDLLRVGRNTNMIDWDELKEQLDDQEQEE